MLASASGAYAQSITPANDGLNTNVNQAGNQYNITGGTQAGANLFHSLQKLGLSTGEIANFLSNPSIQNILTRVTGGEASLINGLIQVTGGNSNLFIMNPAGIIFGSNASLNVPANFSASTATGIQVGNGWFGINSSVDEVRKLNGNPTGYAFSSTFPSLGTTQSGVILNQGILTTSLGKSVTLVGGIVVNTGTIATPSGNITIAATPDNKFVKITSEGNVLSLELPIADRQAIGNAPVLRGIDLPSLLTGKTAGTAIVSGNLEVSGNKGGNVQVLGDNVSLVSANINVSGVNGGGTVLVGGNLQGADTTPKSQSTTVDRNSTIRADALNNGNGGNAIVWSDGNTRFDGNISATGGILSGNGGFAEVSGKQGLSYSGLVNLQALNGSTGNLLLDPANLVIANTGGDITPSTVVNQWNAANTTYAATSSLTVNDPVAGNSNNNLTLDSPTVNLNAGITNTGVGSLLGATNNTTVNVGTNGLIQNGVDVSANGANVNLAAATYTLGATVNINKDLTVNGAGANNTTVSGNNAIQVFNIGNNSAVNINDLTIANGKNINGNGGGVYINPESTLSLNNTNFSGNLAQRQGGAIYSFRGTAIISNSNFSSNSAQDFGGVGGAIYNELGSVTIGNSNFSGNSAQDLGGAIYSWLGTATISNSNFSGNSALRGGAIFTSETATIINGSNFSGNSAREYGGAIAIYAGTAFTINNSNFSENSAGNDVPLGNFGAGGAIYNNYRSSVTISNSIFSGNSVPDRDSSGGAISNFGTATISNSIFSGNFANNALGGAIINVLDTIAISNSTFSNNSSRDGGAIFNFGTATINNSTFSANFAIESGGAIRNINLGSSTIANSILVGNNAPNGAEVSNSSTLNFTGANIVGTNGVNGISGTFTGVTPIIPTGAANTVINTTLADNGGSTQTYALLPNSPAIEAGNANLATMTDQRGLPRFGKTDIGAVEYQFKVTNTNDAGLGSFRSALNNTNASNNTETVIFRIPTTDSGYTGSYWSITPISSLPTITKSVIIDGYTQTGAIVNSLLDSNNAQLKIELNGANAGAANGLTLGLGSDGSTIKGLAINGFSQAGIALISGNNAIAGNFIGTNITGTLAKGNGLAGISIESANNVIGGATPVDRNLIAFNTRGINVLDNLLGNQILGDIILGNTNNGINIGSGSTVNIDKVIFANNTTTKNGGAINNNGTANISNSIFSSNSAYSGGAIFNRKTLEIANSYFFGNSADYGGAIFNGGIVTISNSNFSNNLAQFGGAIYTSSSLFRASNTISNSNFLENLAQLGGAIYAEDFFGNLYNDVIATISNSTFYSNIASQGGAIHIKRSTVTIEDSTFLRNLADYGGAIANIGSKITIANSNFFANSANYDGGAIYNIHESYYVVDDLVTSVRSYYSLATVSNSNFFGNSANNGGAIYNSYYGLRSQFYEGTVNMINSFFLGNFAIQDGGAIFNEREANIINSFFFGNFAIRNGNTVYGNGKTTIINQ